STPELRKQVCEQEVRLNRRLARDVYLGIVPVVDRNGTAAFEGDEAPIDWAVKMRRLPEDATLESRLKLGEIDDSRMIVLARRLARFHAAADSGPQIAEFGRFENVARNLRENFVVSEPCVGRTVSSAVFERTRGLTDQLLTRLRPLIDRR